MVPDDKHVLCWSHLLFVERCVENKRFGHHRTENEYEIPAQKYAQVSYTCI